MVDTVDTAGTGDTADTVAVGVMVVQAIALGDNQAMAGRAKDVMARLDKGKTDKRDNRDRMDHRNKTDSR